MRVLNASQSPLMAKVRGHLHQHGFETRFTPGTRSVDGRLVVKGHGTSQVFMTQEFSRSLDVGAELVQVMLPAAKANSDSSAPLIIAPTIAERAGDQLWGAGLSFLDSKGRGYLRLEGLSYELDPLGRGSGEAPRERGTSGARASSAFAPAGLSVALLALLSPSTLAEPLRAIADLVPASLGTVQAAVSDLERSGYASRLGMLLEPDRLLDDWTSAYLRTYPRWHPSQRYDTDYSLAQLRQRLDGAEELATWISGEAAAEAMGLPIRSTSTMIYVDGSQKPHLKKLLRLRRSETGAVMLASAFWSPTIAPPPYAPGPVIRADLMASRDPRQFEMVPELETHDPVLRRLKHRG